MSYEYSSEASVVDLILSIISHHFLMKWQWHNFQILGKHGFDPSPDGHLDFTMAAHKVLRSLGPKTALTLPNPFQKMAVQVFDLENPEPFSPR